MAPTAPTMFAKFHSNGDEGAIDQEELSEEMKDLILSLPRERGWRTKYLYLFQGFWCQPAEIQAISTFQKHFQAKHSDVFVATVPKSGTTWLKALTFAIVNRQKHLTFSKSHPLLNSNPHDLVPFIEYTVYGKHDKVPDLSKIPEPRLFGTHIPFSSLPNSITKGSNCKIVYICRNPFDTFISSWCFVNKIKPPSLPTLMLEEAFDMFCNGVVGFGPFWNHMLGYWNESIERPNKVLFLKYEDMKEDPVFHLKKIAEFLGCSFSLEEESGGVIENIIDLCSFEKMKELEVNKSGTFARIFKNKFLFRKAEIGDFVNHLSPFMVEKLSKVMEEKLGGCGLSFRVNSQ
ncbi:cytosolic sulfotransferase 15-like [Lotus japonicus]|uniref:cytosolic sulfotransferase 15-like n=1 Tax=Lotus japonicus TaxID=34305 RepID=UPI00258D2653|nr:cytosolic sulfotransferase 15-like [Lotus japonicus]